jgi:hypothetical protein
MPIPCVRLALPAIKYTLQRPNKLDQFPPLLSGAAYAAASSSAGQGSSMDQQLSSAALHLEQVLCKGLGIAPPPAALRNIKLKALKDGTAQRFPEVSLQLTCLVGCQCTMRSLCQVDWVTSMPIGALQSSAGPLDDTSTGQGSARGASSSHAAAQVRLGFRACTVPREIWSRWHMFEFVLVLVHLQLSLNGRCGTRTACFTQREGPEGTCWAAACLVNGRAAESPSEEVAA